MKTINKPAIRIIQSYPTTLGTIDYYMVIYDQDDLPLPDSNLWFEENEAEIADGIYETGAYNNIYVLHATSTRGADIHFLEKGKELSLFNRINCDSVLSYHCLSVKTVGQNIQIRTGFHELAASETMPSLSLSWDAMSTIYNGYLELETNEDAFFRAYHQAMEVWKNNISSTHFAQA